MDAATIAILKKAVDLARVGIEYVQHDQQVMLGLRKPQWVEFHGKGIGRGNFEMNGFRITSVSGGDTVRLGLCAVRSMVAALERPRLGRQQDQGWDG